MHSHRQRIPYVPPGTSAASSRIRGSRRFTTKSQSSQQRAGVSLMETLCVLCILSILSGLYGWAVFQAVVKIKAFIDTLQ